MNSEDLGHEFKLQASALLDQALEKIINCLEQIDDRQLWWRPTDEMNSIGNLLLHINGNLRQWAITSLTDCPDQRQRETEFSPTERKSAAELLHLTRNTVADAKTAIAGVTAEKLLDRIDVQGFEVNVMQAILHTTSHFQGHTHQIIQLTRIQLGDRYRFHWEPNKHRRKLPM